MGFLIIYPILLDAAVFIVNVTAVPFDPSQTTSIEKPNSVKGLDVPIPRYEDQFFGAASLATLSVFFPILAMLSPLDR